MNHSPLVSVIMTVYNTEKYLKDAINSILSQTYSNIEFIIIDDCSCDSSLQIINTFKDPRIININLKKNKGISTAANFGIKKSKGKYIVRMDSDDISLPNRIEKQVEFLETNTEYIVCGSNYKILDSDVFIKVPEGHKQIKTILLERSCIANPTAVIRKNILEDNNIFYNEKLIAAEDYNLWIDLIFLGKFHNIQENLVEYRIHPNQISQKQKQKQDINTLKIKVKYLQKNFTNLNSYDFEIYNKLFSKIDDLMFFKELKYFLNKLIVLNDKNKKFDTIFFNNFIKNLKDNALKNFFFKVERYTIVDFFKYIKVCYKFKISLSIKDSLKLFLKSIFFYKIKTRSL